jgi:prepilin peptidase CpaA
MDTFGQYAILLLYALVAVAAAADAATRRVPNALAVAIGTLGVVHQLQSDGIHAALVAAGTGALVLIVLILPWSRRVLGGGDVKLAAACATWVGWERLPTFLLATALAGGLVAVATGTMALRRAAAAGVDKRSTPSGVARARKAKVPYSLAIAAGAVAALHWRIP